MHLSYSLDSTTIEVTEAEHTRHQRTLNKARKAEERKGRTVTVLVRLEIHEAGQRQIDVEPLSRLFPRPVCNMGAIVPEIVADKLRDYAAEREQPLSDLTRTLWTEFLIAKERGEKRDEWAKFIESQLGYIQDIRTGKKKKVSYARTRRMKLRPSKRKRRRSSR